LNNPSNSLAEIFIYYLISFVGVIGLISVKHQKTFIKGDFYIFYPCALIGSIAVALLIFLIT